VDHTSWTDCTQNFAKNSNLDISRLPSPGSFIFSQYSRKSIKLVQIRMDFSSGSVVQCAVRMIEKGAGVYVNLGGMMVTGFGYHCKQEGLGSNPGMTLFFFFHSHLTSKLCM
jgi:hypothetical protein